MNSFQSWGEWADDRALEVLLAFVKHPGPKTVPLLMAQARFSVMPPADHPRARKDPREEAIRTALDKLVTHDILRRQAAAESYVLVSYDETLAWLRRTYGHLLPEHLRGTPQPLPIRAAAGSRKTAIQMPEEERLVMTSTLFGRVPADERTAAVLLPFLLAGKPFQFNHLLARVKLVGVDDARQRRQVIRAELGKLKQCQVVRCLGKGTGANYVLNSSPTMALDWFQRNHPDLLPEILRRAARALPSSRFARRATSPSRKSGHYFA